MERASHDYVYLDYAATSPLVDEAAAALEPFLVAGREGVFANANANSLHSPGREAYRLMEQARRIWPQVETIEDAAVWIRSAQETWQAYRREQSHLQDVLLALKKRQGETGGDGEQRLAVERARQEQNRTRQAAQAAAQLLAEMEGKAKAIGDRETLLTAGREIGSALTRTEEHRRAIVDAERVITEKNAARAARVSPRITALA